MIKMLRFCFLLGALSINVAAFSQEQIPVGQWRLHVSFNNIRSVAISADFVYAAAANAVLVYDRSDGSTSVYNKLNGLSGVGISEMAYDATSNSLMIAYGNGTFDLLQGTKVAAFDPARNTVLTGSRAIHSISFSGQQAYLSTDYGVVVFDLPRSEVKETWRDLGIGGETLAVFGAAFYRDSVFLATADGVLAGDPDDNLLDFSKWKRMASGDLSGDIDFIAVHANALYAAINGNGVFKYSDGTWVKTPFLENKLFTSFRAAEGKLLITESESAWILDDADVLVAVDHELVTIPNTFNQDEGGNFWIGDERNGLLSNRSGTFQSINPNGPHVDRMARLSFQNKKMYAVGGGHAGNAALQNAGKISYFSNGLWESFEVPFRDVTDVALLNSEMFVSSFGSGVLNESADVVFDESNSTLVNTNPPGRNVKITALHTSPRELWVANYGTSSSLHRFSADQGWESFSFPFSAARYPLDVLTDFAGNAWMRLDPATGGGILVYDPLNDEFSYLTEIDESGELPTTAVYSIAIDRDGYVWAGTDAGVAYFYDKGSDAVKPIFENRFLLRDERVTAIAVDGGNRKWMGTTNGAWLFDPLGEKLIQYFNTANSPLPSNAILDVEIEPVSGEVFFATEGGLVSYRANATESLPVFQKVKIFPNPVPDNFQGEVGISGLATDAIVKITDVSGKLVFQTTANGGTASWDVRDHQGRRVPTGVFLVFAVTGDGAESVVGKIAVIN